VNDLVSFGDHDDEVIRYQGVVTREFPLWKLTLTGGDLPEAGHVMTSMSYARLLGDMNDWLHWRQFGTPSSTYGWPEPSFDDDEYGDEDAYECRYGDQDADYDYDDLEDEDQAELGGSGYGVTFDCRWPQPAKDALERYWAAKKAMDDAREAMTEPICTLADELQAEERDVARIVFMPTRKVRQIILRHNQREHERLAREERESAS
jgi:hypothetical protein